MTNEMIVVEHATKRYVKYDDSPLLLTRVVNWRSRTRRTDLLAVKDADFTVASGECVGVIGRNGSGKSTLLRMLAGVTAPTTGRVMVRGRIAPLIAVGVGFHQELTGRENVFVSGTVLGLSRREIERRFDEIVAFAELEKFIDTPVKFYSSGMFVRLGFAVSIKADPDVLLVDEVLAVGDIAFQLRCFERMAALREAGTTIVVVSHNLSAIRRMCPRTIVMHDGNLVHDGDTPAGIGRYHDLLGEARDIEEGATPISDDDNVDVSATVEELTLLDSSGMSTRHVAVGDRVRLSVTIRATKDIVDAVFGATVVNGAGIHVYGDTASWGEAIALRAGEKARLTLEFTATLATGSYGVTLALVRRDGTLLTPPGQEILFYVTGRPLVNGIADLEGEFTVAREVLTD